MADNSEYLLGQIDGKLDSLTELVRDHVKDDRDRFDVVFAELGKHAADINQAKGAKRAVFALAAGISGVIGTGIALAQHLIK